MSHSPDSEQIDITQPLSPSAGTDAAKTTAPLQSVTSESEKTPVQEVVSFIVTLVTLVTIAFSFRILVIEPFKIPSGSMIPTLHIGDYILVTKWDFGVHLPFVPEALMQWDEPNRGDIVVFKRPDDPTTRGVDESVVNIIKRVMAVGGDTIEVKRDKVFLNGTLLEENEYTTQWIGGGTEDFGPEVVPDNHIFLMGDNRDRSKDSRFWEPSPFLPTSMVLGKARMIFWRWDNMSRIGTFLK